MKLNRVASADSRLPSVVLLLLPSFVSVVMCLLLGVMTVGLYLLFISLHQGTLFPALFDGQWAISYTNTVVGPVSSFFGSPTLNAGLLTLLWGIVGATLYEAVIVVWGAISEWREVEHDVQITVDDGVIRHPMRRSFVVRLLWRVLVLVILVMIIVLLRPVMQNLLVTSGDLARSAAPGLTNLGMVCRLVLSWALIGHVFVVIGRLFVQRVRL